MNDMLRILISLYISASIIAVILLSIKILIKYKISKTWQYYIWIIAISIYLIPFLVEVDIPYINNIQYKNLTSYSDREFFDYYSTDSKQYFDNEVQSILDNGGNIYDIMILIPYMSLEKVCSVVTDYIDRTGEYSVMYNTRQFMDIASIDKVTLYYVNRTYDFEGVSAMLQFMSEDASNYVAQKYFENSEDLTYSYLFKPYLKKEYESINISSKPDSSSPSSPLDTLPYNHSDSLNIILLK